MAAAVVYEGVPHTQGSPGALFQGQKFWFSAGVPQRKRFMEDVIANGGEVVPLEKQADVLLVDHTKPNPAPGTHSYQYVERSIRNGRLENLDDHAVGETSRAERPVGSVTLAPKSGRNAYTEADDQFLWNWVKPLEDAGGAVAGNAIYQQLEAANPRHTYQSWRDRWLKYVRHQKRQVTTQAREQQPQQSTPRRQRVQPRPGSIVDASPGQSRVVEDAQAPRQKSVEVVIPRHNSSPDPGTAPPVLDSKGKASSRRNLEYEQSGKPIFTGTIYDDFFAAAPYILATPVHHLGESWAALARQKEADAKEEQEKAMQEGKVPEPIPVYSAEDWRAYFELVVGPDYEEQLQKETGKRSEDYLLNHQSSPASIITQKPEAENGSPPAQESLAQNGGSRPHAFSRQESPVAVTSRPDSPTLSVPTTQDRAPDPSEVQEWSAAKGTDSHGSATNTAIVVASIEEPSERKTQSQNRKRPAETDDDAEDSPSLPPFGNQEQAKRRRPKEEPIRLEIRSPSEHSTVRRAGGSAEGQDPSQEGESLTPRPQRSPHTSSGRDDRSSSPLFVPQGPTLSNRGWSNESDDGQLPLPVDAEEDGALASAPRRRERTDQDTQTSPLSIHLVSNQDPPSGSSFSQTRSETHQDFGSPTPEFETASAFSQAWETAQEDAQALGGATPWSRDGTVAETRLEDEFALPAPEDGWSDLPLPPEADEESIVGEAEPQDGDDALSEAESIGAWVAAHLQADADADDELLFKAAAIADLDFKLADVVYQRLVQGKPVPENMRGVWTERDDMALRGNDPNEIKRVEEKHGKESLAGRWQWLENELK